MAELALTRHRHPDGTPRSLAEYTRTGGYLQARRAWQQLTPAELVQLVSRSGLRGRGGAGFPTGKKWSFMPPPDGSPGHRYLICNFDEMEPGTYKDRFLVEGDPHLLIEGMLIAAAACQCDTGYIFLRGEYGVVRERLTRALAEAEQAGWIGAHAGGSDRPFRLHLHLSAGRYICGEETGLLNALEGRRANPRAKPPFPVQVGAWGRPSVVNNVETLGNLPAILREGPDWYRGLGRGADAGTKLYAASGRVRRPHCAELPLGITLRELVFEEMGGMQEGRRFVAALPGGGSTRFLGEDGLDLPLDFGSLQAAGLSLGTGTAIVVDDGVCPVDLLRNLAQFYARESCGWCTPCREGLPWVEGLLRGIEEGTARPGDLELLEEQLGLIGPNTFCAFALGAVQPLASGLQLFHQDFAEHLRLGRCPRRR
ncbi:MAG: NADH-ubiquinone oxidoreductase-F iron-sulfur binding region domain-containing protein [Myxococcota bacterium]|jgi:NADH-quinone oxidoreductase subunit F|nr:NADH-ubiquinone oxidoreductase-F iron-sulfur binding region domain-containing protein [Myxococcota bacterium]